MSAWSVWVLEYAVAETFPWSLSVYGAHNAGTHRAPFSYVVLKQGELVILVDVGFGSSPDQMSIAEGSDVTDWRGPREVLGQIGLAPEDVTHVLITHAHYDHFGNVGAFPKANFFISGHELQFWTTELAVPASLRTFTDPIDPADLIAAVELAAQNRLHVLSDAAENLFPGIDMLPAWNTHTPGSMYIRVATTDGPLVLAGDNVYAWENLEGWNGDGRLHPVGLVVGSNRDATHILRTMLEDVDGQTRRVIPVHEDHLRHDYPSRTAENGAMIAEVALGPGETSHM